MKTKLFFLTLCVFLMNDKAYSMGWQFGILRNTIHNFGNYKAYGNGLFAKTCLEYKTYATANNKTVTDGVYRIKPSSVIFNVYCNNMAGATPQEYLELPLKTTVPSSPTYNYSTYGGAPGESVNLTIGADITVYSKVKINPMTLIVDTSDMTFSTNTRFTRTSDGSYHGPVDWGAASGCRSDYGDSGRANVDLTGTPFKISTLTTWAIQSDGWHSAGSATFNANRTTVNLTGGGYCGGYYPSVGGVVRRIQLEFQ